jgi:hypothetical protein
MMTATAAEAPALAPALAEDYVSLAEAVRLSGRTAIQIRTLAMLGRIEIDAPPGCRVRYSRADVAALARPQVALAS